MTQEPLITTLGQLGKDAVDRALGSSSLLVDLGLVTLRIHSRARDLAGPLTTVYRHFTPQSPIDWADLDVNLDPIRSPRRWLRPQIRLVADGLTPFEPFPPDHAFPLLEWGANWLIGRRMNDVLLMHAGVLERNGLALVMPALPGSGKSTLTAALSLRGWRLLSDEFGAYDAAVDGFRTVLKPVALKNQSIEVIRQFEPGAEMGPEFEKTRKGTVAHLAPSADAVARRHDVARPGAIVLPRWQAGSATRWKPVQTQVAFSSLAFNAFNYAVLGAAGFHAVVGLVRRCPAWQLIYSDLDDAIRTLDQKWPDVISRNGDRTTPVQGTGARETAESVS